MRILGVGVAALDLVQTLDSYPAENSEQRVRSRQRRLGGNAANSLRVLAQLGHECEWLGTLADDDAAAFICSELDRRGIRHGCCPVHANGHSPTSWVTLAEDTGSRTIQHYRELPELRPEDFRRVALQDFDWIHFEGRNPDALAGMIRRARDAGTARLSLELEKQRPGLEAVLAESLPHLDCLLIGHEFAVAAGHADGRSLLRALDAGCAAFCAWGERGAWWRDPAGSIGYAAAFAPGPVVDTLGAGDVFNAAVIDALLGGAAAEQACARGCELAGRKCGQPGLDNLRVVAAQTHET